MNMDHVRETSKTIFCKKLRRKNDKTYDICYMIYAQTTKYRITAKVIRKIQINSFVPLTKMLRNSLVFILGLYF